MGNPFRSFFGAIGDAYGELFSVVGMNLIWFFGTLPVYMVSVFLIGPYLAGDDPQNQAAYIYAMVAAGVFWVVGPSPLLVGVHLWAHRLVNDQRIEFSIFWEGLREFWRPALALCGIAIAGNVLLLMNAAFYLRSEVGALRLFGVVWVWATLLWVLMQMYWLPLLIVQEDRRLRLVLRNSLLFTVAQGIPSFVLFVLLGVIVSLSALIMMPYIFLAGGVAAIATTRMTHSLIERFRPRPAGP